MSNSFAQAAASACKTSSPITGTMDRIASAVRERDAHEELSALTVGIRVEELDTAVLPEDLRDGFFGYYLERKDGHRVLAFPAGQNPVERLHAARVLLAKVGATA
ncbi:hypothetical protein [Streptomyces sp. V3I7]|uniref:hypothetical protein n=1 Tax=Streptomyces sp. V3I7 TaxID=3042278 RepID=UPI00277D657F|nr:hypothetical protein [Streptomyces sp. V3I7]MDQ0992200.1 hypothetical protein [Streptomyces sp. V3I7]